MRCVEYAGGGGSFLEMWNFQEGVGHGKRCCICRRRWDIAGHVDYAGGGGTLLALWNIQEWVGH